MWALSAGSSKTMGGNSWSLMIILITGLLTKMRGMGSVGELILYLAAAVIRLKVFRSGNSLDRLGHQMDTLLPAYITYSITPQDNIYNRYLKLSSYSLRVNTVPWSGAIWDGEFPPFSLVFNVAYIYDLERPKSHIFRHGAKCPFNKLKVLSSFKSISMAYLHGMTIANTGTWDKLLAKLPS